MQINRLSRPLGMLAALSMENVYFPGHRQGRLGPPRKIKIDRSSHYPKHGTGAHECERRRRQIAAGRLKKDNGLWRMA